MRCGNLVNPTRIELSPAVKERCVYRAHLPGIANADLREVKVYSSPFLNKHLKALDLAFFSKNISVTICNS